MDWWKAGRGSHIKRPKGKMAIALVSLSERLRWGLGCEPGHGRAGAEGTGELDSGVGTGQEGCPVAPNWYSLAASARPAYKLAEQAAITGSGAVGGRGQVPCVRPRVEDDFPGS